MIRKKIVIIFVLSLFLVLPITAQAFMVKNDDSIYVAEGEIIEGNLYAAGVNIIVDGEVAGDVICGGQSVTINGKVAGDVICGAQVVTINGEVGGSARVAGNLVTINGQIARNVNAFGASIVLSPDATVGWDMLMAGQTGDIRGKIGGDLHGGGAKVVIAGEVGGRVKLNLDSQKYDKKKTLEILDSAVIGSGVVYTAGNQAAISDGAQIAGEVKHNLPKIKSAKKKIAKLWGIGKIYSIFSALVIGLVLISLWRKQIMAMTNRMRNKVAPSIGWGAVVMFLTPIIAFILMFTLIGIPLAAMLIGVWLIALFLSKILVGIMVGQAIMERLWKKNKSLIWAMIIGIVVAWILFALPFIGWLLALVAIWWGLGGLWLAFRDR